MTDRSWVAAEDYDGPIDHDFDAAWAERNPKRIKVRGRVYTLPAERPAKVIILLAREEVSRTRTGKRDIKLLEEILRVMLTPDGYQQMLDDGVSIEQLADIVTYCMRAYNTEGDSTGEA